MLCASLLRKPAYRIVSWRLLNDGLLLLLISSSFLFSSVYSVRNDILFWRAFFQAAGVRWVIADVLGCVFLRQPSWDNWSRPGLRAVILNICSHSWVVSRCCTPEVEGGDAGQSCSATTCGTCQLSTRPKPSALISCYYCSFKYSTMISF